MINIVFSKDRAMQLHAYLESINYYLGNMEVFVISPSTDLITYRMLREYHPKVSWASEQDVGGFDRCLRAFINGRGDAENVLFGTDDVIYHQFIDQSVIDNTLCEPEVLGFSLRLGDNTAGFNRLKNRSNNPIIFKYEWPNLFGHYGYPLDLSCSAYRISTIKKIINYSQELLPIPNSLESRGVHLLCQGIENRPLMATLNSSSICSIVDLNRVQDIFRNRIQGDETTTPENLEKMFLDGYRIDWRQYFNIKPSDPFIGKYKLSFIKV